MILVAVTIVIISGSLPSPRKALSSALLHIRKLFPVKKA